MHYLITYYSYSENTEKVAQILARALRSKGEVDMQRLRPKEEIRTFFGQCRAAITRKRAVLDGKITFDVSPYELILIGSPVWAFAPTPAINTYLDNLSGLAGKRVLVFLTSGSGIGVKRCFDNINMALKNKGASEIYELNIQDRKVMDEDFVISCAKKFL